MDVPLRGSEKIQATLTGMGGLGLRSAGMNVVTMLSRVREAQLSGFGRTVVQQIRDGASA